MNEEVLAANRGFIVNYFLFLLLSSVTLIVPVFSNVSLLPWTILNLLFMITVFVVIFKFKAGIIFSVVRFLVLTLIVLIIPPYGLFAFLLGVSSFGLYIYEEVSYGIFFHILFLLPPAVLFLIYFLLAEYIFSKEGVSISVMTHGKRRFKDFCLSYIVVVLAYFPFAYYCLMLRNYAIYPPHMYSTDGLYILGYWFVTYVVFIAGSLYVIHNLCRKGQSMKLYRLAMVNAGVMALLWIVIALVFLYAGVENPFMWIFLPVILNIPLIIMLVLYVKAKRMYRMYPSEPMEVVRDREYAAFDRMGDSVEWKADEQLTPEQEKKSETRMETDF